MDARPGAAPCNGPQLAQVVPRFLLAPEAIRLAPDAGGSSGNRAFRAALQQQFLRRRE